MSFFFQYDFRNLHIENDMTLVLQVIHRSLTLRSLFSLTKARAAGQLDSHLGFVKVSTERKRAPCEHASSKIRTMGLFSGHSDRLCA